MKSGELFNKHFCKKINFPKLQISTFHIISLWKLSVAIATKAIGHWQKNITYVEGNVIRMFAKFQLHSSYGF